MAKEYFSHDYNARNDKKISALVKDYKSTGYGIFWCACEMMHEEGGNLELDELTYHAIAKDLNEEDWLVKEILEKCVSKYKLFTKNEAVLEANEAKMKLTSSRVIRNLNGREAKKKEKVEAGRIGGIKSGESRRNKANRSNASSNEPKERKGKEIKVNTTIEAENFSSDVEKMILNDPIRFEQIMMNAKRKKEDENICKDVLRKYHLFLIQKNKYPQSKTSLYAGFETWLINEKNYSANGNNNHGTVGKTMVFDKP